MYITKNLKILFKPIFLSNVLLKFKILFLDAGLISTGLPRTIMFKRGLKNKIPKVGKGREIVTLLFNFSLILPAPIQPFVGPNP